MRRSEICAIALMPAQTFMTHRAKDNLPFEVAEIDGGGRKWVRYDIHHAAVLIAARNLTDQGVPWSTATAILRAKPVHTARDPLPWKVDYIHVAKASFRNFGGDVPFTHKAEEVFQGRIEAIAELAYRWQKLENEKPHTSHVVCTGLISVNLSQAYHVAFARAEALGIDLGNDDITELDQ